MEYNIVNGSSYWTGSTWGSLQFAKVYKSRDRAIVDAKRLGGVFVPFYGKAAPAGSKSGQPERRPNYYKAK